MDIRPYTPTDRAAALALLKNERAIDDQHHRIHISDDGTGLALWVKPTAGDIAYLGPVLTQTPNRRLFYGLIRACVSEMVGEGFRRAYFVTHDSRLVTRIRRDFTVTVEVYGRNGKTQEPVSWRIEVDLADALAQLEVVLRD